AGRRGVVVGGAPPGGLEKSRGRQQSWLRDPAADQYGQPFYSPLGRTKTFDESDIARIREAAREEERCRLNLYCPGRARRRTTRVAANTSGSTLTEALRLAGETSRSRSSASGSARSSSANLRSQPSCPSSAPPSVI